MATETIGLIGLGAMGSRMARRLVDSGHRVVGYDLDAAARGALTAMGGTALESTRQVAEQATIVLVVVIDDEQVRQACLGPDGLFANACAGTVTVVMSSVSPDSCIELARRASERGQHLIDAPMIRGEAAAAAGKLLLMVGGPKDIVDRCRAPFAAIASDCSHLGAVGTGQVGKMVNNMLLWATILANQEGIEFAKRLGVDPKVLRESLYLSSGDNWALHTWEAIVAQPKWWHQKDLAVMLGTADQHGLGLPFSAELKRQMALLSMDSARSLFLS